MTLYITQEIRGELITCYDLEMIRCDKVPLNYEGRISLRYAFAYQITTFVTHRTHVGRDEVRKLR